MTTTPEHRTATPPEAGARPSRRAVVTAAAWAAPTITVLSAAPAFAASAPSGTSTVTESTGLASSGTGVVYLALDPAPTTAPAPVITYTDTGTTTTSFTPTGASGTAAVYRLAFTTTTRPVPTTITAVITIDRYGTATAPVTLQTAGTLDTRFADPVLNMGTAANYGGLALQPDGKVLVAGDFSAVGTLPRRYIARFNRDGSLDQTFVDSGLDGAARSVAVAPDGGILVGGAFKNVRLSSTTTAPRGGLARFTASGMLDHTAPDPNLNDRVYGIVLQPDGKVLVAGIFSTAGADNLPRRGVARFNANGTLDTTFADPKLLTGAYALALQPDGRIIVAGSFTTAGADNTPRRRLVRLRADGTLDTSFADPNLDAIAVDCLVQPDGKVLVAGTFTTAGADSTPMSGVARFNSDGTLDTGFANPHVPNAIGLALQPDGKVVVCGLFATAGAQGATRSRLARLASDGTLDPTFADPNLEGGGSDVVLDADGLVYVTGTFARAGSPIRRQRYLARVHG